MVADPIPFVDLKAQYAALKPTIDQAIQTVLDHGRFILGPEVATLERALAEFSGCDHVVTVANGTDALIIALLAEGVGPGDAVFLPAFTFPATAEAPLLLGATPVFVDVCADSFNIDPVDLTQKVGAVAAGGRFKPRAVIAVDLFGHPADYAAINQVAVEHGLFVLADAAQSFGARCGHTQVGRLASATATSFFPAKPLGCYGDGGALLTEDPDRAAAYRAIRVHGAGREKYEIARLGMNSRLDSLQAAILLAKLKVYDAELRRRDEIAKRYDAALGDVVKLPPRATGVAGAWAQYTIRVDDRDDLATRLRDVGIPTAIYYPAPLHMQKAYASFGGGPGSLPVSEHLARHVLSLPMHAYLKAATQQRIIDGIRDAAHR